MRSDGQRVSAAYREKEGGYAVTRMHDGAFTFFTPSGRQVEPAPGLPAGNTDALLRSNTALAIDVSYETLHRRFLCSLCECYLEAKLLESPNVMALDPLLVGSVEVVAAEVLVIDAVGKHVPERHQHGVLDGHDRTPCSTSCLDAVVQRPVVA